MNPFNNLITHIKRHALLSVVLCAGNVLTAHAAETKPENWSAKRVSGEADDVVLDATSDKTRVATLIFNRDVSHMKFGFLDGVPDAERVGIWIQARQHAWELSGSWTVQGLLDWLATDEAAPLRRRADIVVVPVFDVDGVDAGLTMQPVNPNRLWVDDRPVIYNKAGNGGRGTLESYAEGPADAPLQAGFIRVEKPHEPFPQISQAMKLIRDLDARGRGLAVFLDLHNYAYRSTDAMQFWKVAQRADLPEAQRALFDRFEQAIQSVESVPIRMRMVTLETYAGLGKDSTAPIMADRWVMASCKAPVALTQESAIQQADLPLQDPPQAEHLRRGALLGRVISKYLEP